MHAGSSWFRDTKMEPYGGAGRAFHAKCDAAAAMRQRHATPERKAQIKACFRRVKKIARREAREEVQAELEPEEELDFDSADDEVDRVSSNFDHLHITGKMIEGPDGCDCWPPDYWYDD